MSVATTLLPIDQLSSGVVGVMFGPYRSATSRPFHVTTNAAVSDAGSKAASTARLSVSASSPGDSGPVRSTSPTRQRDLPLLGPAVHHGLAELRALHRRSDEVADVLGREVRIEAGHEDGRAHH